MQSTQPARDTAPGTADLLDWAALPWPGVVLGKSGNLLAGWFFQGPDLDSSLPTQLDWVSGQVNRTLSRFGSGWSTWIDATRMPSPKYFAARDSHFDDPISAMVDNERREHFLASGRHFETIYVLFVCYTPPLRSKGRLLDLVYSEADDDDEEPATAILNMFNRTIAEIEDSLHGVVSLRRMTEFEATDVAGQKQRRSYLLNYLHFALTGEEVSLNLPQSGFYLDTVIGGQPFATGNVPRIGDTHIAVVAVMGLPSGSIPGILGVLDVLPIPLRFSTRFVFLDQPEAAGQIKSIERKWRQKARGFWADVLRMPQPRLDKDSVDMGEEASEALARTNSALVGTGYYTAVVVLMAPTRGEAIENARNVRKELTRIGFATRLETDNAVEAFLGSLPGHTWPNVRRPPVHTDNLADLLPLTSVWTGTMTCPSPHYPHNSPALIQCATTEASPFWLNLLVDELGHTLIFGPTRAGKSTALQLIKLQARRYAGVSIWDFDKGRSGLATTKACGGQHYDIAADGSLGLCPLSVLDTDGDVGWAEEWISICFELQTGRAPETGGEREAIHAAIDRMRASGGSRALTTFVAEVQSDTVRDAMRQYRVDSAIGKLLDAEEDGLAVGRFMTFEVDELMSMGARNLIPVLLYLFRRFERSLHGQPAYLILDEAWVFFGHSVFRDWIIAWLKGLAKLNCCVVMASQSLSDAHRSGMLDVLMESCPTKIFLPNAEAANTGTDDSPGPVTFYRAFGLNDTQIDLIREATPKRHYYVTQPDGCRLVDLQLGPKALAFAGAGSKPAIARINELEARHGADWPAVWLEEQGIKAPWQPRKLAAVA